MIKEEIMDFGGGRWQELEKGEGEVMRDVDAVPMYDVLKIIKQKPFKCDCWL